MSTITKLTFDLDKLRITYPKEKLRLFITPSFKIDCPVDILEHLQQSDILTALRSGSLWSSRGFACQINIRICLLGTSFDSHEQAIEELGTSIRNAELWNQLSLAPSLEIPNRRIASDESDIRIRISHMQPAIGLLEKVVSLSAIPADTKPPDGVPCVGLTSLELDMQFRSISTASRRKPKKPRISKELMLLDDLDFNDERESLLLRGVKSEPKSLFSLSPSDSEVMVKTLENQELLQYVEEDEEAIEDEDEDMLLLSTNSTELLTPPASQSSASQAILPTNLKRALDTEEIDCRDLTLNLELPVALTLTDFGLRTLIGGRQVKATPGVSPLKPEQKYALSDLMPSLWSPGYLKAVSQRSRFLPILSQSLSTSILKSAQSPSLKKALLDLAGLPASPLVSRMNEDREDSHARPQSQSQKVAKVVQARIWKMTQQSLLDPLAARRLLRMDKVAEGASRLWEHMNLLADHTNGTESAVFSSLVDDLADFMEEEQFEDFFGDEDEEEEWIGPEVILQDFAASSDESQRSMERWDAAADKLCTENRVQEASIDIPDEFWDDLHFEEEGAGESEGGDEDDSLFIPESFWEDLRTEEEVSKALESQNSDMLI